jgi:hypothetical protein
MNYTLIFRDKAVKELSDAYKWYETEQQGLGEFFLKTVNEYTEAILKNPEAFKITYKNFRELWIKKFPYLVVYYIDGRKNKIVIISIFHTSRNPKKKFR